MAEQIVHIDPSIAISTELVNTIMDPSTKFTLSAEAIKQITNCRDYLDQKLSDRNDPIYGINTGFGALYNRTIGKNDLEKLQENLVKSHACGTGDEVPERIVRLMLFLKAYGLSHGKSGVQLTTVQRLVDFLNEGIYPCIYEQGSLGASGDLAPLAHLSLPLLGLGEVRYKGELISSEEILRKFQWQPIRLKSKEGLALLNGTQFMSAYASYCVERFRELFEIANIIAALSLEAFDGRVEPFSDLVQKARPHQGQIHVARVIRELLEGSEMINQGKKHVQDPYSFRCIPQVHGASYDAWLHVKATVTTEINSVTDNPTIFAEEDQVISGGNFHGQPLALCLDYLSIAIAEMGSISERRIYQLVNGNRDLPPFLTPEPGLNSGLMIAQYTAASVVSQNKQLCTPASVDTIDSSRGQEDHVSMGANGATRTLRVLLNLEKILAIELLTAAQAFEFRRPLKTSAPLEQLLQDYRKLNPYISDDVLLKDYIDNSIRFIRDRVWKF